MSPLLGVSDAGLTQLHPAQATFPTPLRGRNITNLSNLTSFPYDNSVTPSFRLQEWAGNPKALGIAIDTLLTRHIFYIGSDRSPHSVAAFVTGTTESEWRAQPNQAEEFWPLADEANSDFAIASNIGKSIIRLYYFSGGRLIEARYRNGNWDPASPLQVANTTVNATVEESGPSSGLSTGAQAGIGVGVSVGVLLIAAAVAGLWILRRRKKGGADEETAGSATAATEPTGSGSQDETVVAGVARADSGMSEVKWEAEVKDTPLTPAPREMESPNPASELPESGDRNELPTEKNVPELP